MTQRCVKITRIKHVHECRMYKTCSSVKPLANQKQKLKKVFSHQQLQLIDAVQQPTRFRLSSIKPNLAVTTTPFQDQVQVQRVATTAGACAIDVAVDRGVSNFDGTTTKSRESLTQPVTGCCFRVWLDVYVIRPSRVREIQGQKAESPNT